MNRVVIADDVSGAAEIAGISQRLGWRTHLSTSPQTLPTDASSIQVWVLDANSRELTTAAAAARWQALGVFVAQHVPGVPVFKKIDSVLRGHVAEECQAFARSLGWNDVLLLPANPSRRRCIQNGCYVIEDTPISQTGFAHDPHYPARSDHVLDLLGPLPPGSPKVRIPDVAHADDIREALATVGPTTLVAGAADAFLAICPVAQAVAVRSPDHRGHTLILNGSAAAQDAVITRVQQVSGALLGPEASVRDIAAALQVSSTVHVTLGRHNDDKLRAIADDIVSRDRLHLALTGGATARAVCDLMGLDQFSVLGEWGPGVVRLRPNPPSGGPGDISIKPGSYAWPEPFLSRLS